MAKLGLLGALGGLGAGLQDIGKQMYLRRERALEEARLLAKEERERGFKREEKQLEREHEDRKIETLEKGRASRTQAQIEGRAAEGAANRSSREGIAAKNRANQKELVKLRGQIEASNEAAARRLSDQLSADDVHAVQYGAPDASGYAEVIVILKNGQTRRTGQKVYRPPRVGGEEDDTL